MEFEADEIGANLLRHVRGGNKALKRLFGPKNKNALLPEEDSSDTVSRGIKYLERSHPYHQERYINLLHVEAKFVQWAQPGTISGAGLEVVH